MFQGDLTRGVLKRGKKADGRSENDGYKFVSIAQDVILYDMTFLLTLSLFKGDFTRGLWG